MTIVKQASLDTIIEMIKMKREQEKEAKSALRQVENELHGLYAQARAALQGSGMDLVLTDSLAGTMVTGSKLNILKVEQLQEGDKVLVKMKYGNGEWEEATVNSDVDDDGFGVEEDLSDGSSWVDDEDDKWQFVSRP